MNYNDFQTLFSLSLFCLKMQAFDKMSKFTKARCLTARKKSMTAEIGSSPSPTLNWRTYLLNV